MTQANCFAHHHMTPAEYGFWQLCRDLSAKKGILYFDGRNMVGRFAGTRRNGQSKDYFYGLEKRMIGKGWFEIIERRRRNKASGLWMASMYRVLSHSEWVAKHGTTTCRPEPGEDQPCRDNRRVGELPVGRSIHSSRDRKDVLSGYAPSPVRLLRHNPIDQSDVPNPIAQSNAQNDGFPCPAVQTGDMPKSTTTAEVCSLEQPSVPPVEIVGQVGISYAPSTSLKTDDLAIPDYVEWDIADKRWVCRRDIGRGTTAQEIAEIRRLNNEHIRPLLTTVGVAQ